MVGSVVEDVVKVRTENDFSHGAESDAGPYYLLSPFYEFQVSPFDHAISTSQSLQPCLLIQHNSSMERAIIFVSDYDIYPHAIRLFPFL